MTDSNQEDIKQSVIANIVAEISGLTAEDISVMLSAGSVAVDVTIGGSNPNGIAHEVLKRSETLASTITSSVSLLADLPMTGEAIKVVGIHVVVVEKAPSPESPCPLGPNSELECGGGCVAGLIIVIVVCFCCCVGCFLWRKRQKRTGDAGQVTQVTQVTPVATAVGNQVTQEESAVAPAMNQATTGEAKVPAGSEPETASNDQMIDVTVL